MLRPPPNRLSKVSPPKIAIFAAMIWFLVNLALLTCFPTVFIDEAENANHVYNAAYHGQAVFTLYDDLYPALLSPLRQAWPVVIRPFYVRPLAWWLRGVGFSLFKARLFSLITGLLCLFVIYLVGTYLYESSGGLAAMALLGTYFPFLYTSHSIRPEVLLTLAGLCAFGALMIGMESRRPRWFLLAGALTGVSPGIHTNGIALLLPVGVMLYAAKSWRAVLWAAIGWLSGTLLFIHYADWDRFVPGYYALFFREFTTPPLVASHGNPLQILGDEAGRYFGPWIYPHWKGGMFFSKVIGIQHVVYGGVLLWGVRQKGLQKAAATFGLLLAAAYALFVGQKSANYLAVLAPFFALAGSGWLHHLWQNRSQWGNRLTTRRAAITSGIHLAGLVVLTITTIETMGFVCSAASYRPRFLDITARLAAQIPISSRVAGPQELWLGLYPFDYRDIGALAWHRLLLGTSDLWTPLEGWKPPYVILESSLARRLARLGKDRPRGYLKPPTGLFPWPHEVMDILPVGPAYGDMLYVIHIDWNKKSAT